MANSSDKYEWKKEGSDIWFPKPEIMNEAAGGDEKEYDCYLRTGSPDYVFGLTAGERGGTWVNCISRLRVTLNAELILKAYPWDTQRAYMTIESQESTSEKVIWVPTGAASLVPPGGPNAVSGWKITSTGSTTGLHVYNSLGETYADLTYWIVVERIPDYFIVRRVVSHPLA
jgi:hypothetical protein